MLNKSIAYRLSIYISLAVISVFIAFIGIYILFQKKMLNENIRNRAIGQSKEISLIVDRYLTATREIASNISEQIIFYGQHDHPDLFLKNIAKKYPYINAISINMDTVVNDVAFRNYYCFRKRDSLYFIQQNKTIITCANHTNLIEKLAEKKVPSWSEAFRCNRNNELIVPYYEPIIHKGRVAGEVVCELSLTEINKAIGTINIEGKGMAFLVSKQGTYLTHPNEEWIFDRNIYSLPHQVYNKDKINVKEILEGGKEGSVIAYPEYDNFEKSWIFYSPISENGWTLIFILPYKEMLEPLYLPILKMLFFSVLGILFIYLLVTYISNKQIQPLSSITQQLKKFSSFTGEDSTFHENEINQITESLNYMKWWYERYKILQSEEEQKSKTRKRDIRQASEIQQSFIKMNFPAFPDRNDIDLYASYKPAKGVSGDLFDYFFIDEYHLVFTIGDVSGKGIPAAFFMSVAQTIIKKNAGYTSAKTIVEKANRELYTNNQHQFFLTLLLGVLNVETGELSYCNAAHTGFYILNKRGDIITHSDSHGLPLGLYADKDYGESKVQLSKEDSIVIYTDGVSELLDENKLQYGTQRLEENLRSLAGMSPKEMIGKIEKSLDLFIGSTEQSDDISLMILKYKP